MRRHFFDYQDGDFANTISNNMAIDSDGDLLMKIGDDMAMDMDSGELHITSGWDLTMMMTKKNGNRVTNISLLPFDSLSIMVKAKYAIATKEKTTLL